jgi:hypothetical protein
LAVSAKYSYTISLWSNPLHKSLALDKINFRVKN